MRPDAEYRAAARRWYKRVIDLTARPGATAAGGHVGTLTVPDSADPATRAQVQLQQSDGLADHHWPFTPERNATGLVDPARVPDTSAEVWRAALDERGPR
jgi:hypothetical protein